MGKEIRGGIIVGAAVLVAAIAYSMVYFQQGLLRYESGGLSIILVMVWVLVVAVLLVVVWQRMLVREEYMRKFYVGPDSIFNFELGVKPLDSELTKSDADELVKHLRGSLSKLTYDNSPLDPPAGFKPTFCVSTLRFVSGKHGEDWRGSVQRIQQRENGNRTFVEVGDFENAEQLAGVLKKIM
ncbi:MAG: hypothetical protein Q4D27_09785 [Coriobacteriia bacterium]|nr:hypothetical protein [Coriobacteriia bacterium]